MIVLFLPLAVVQGLRTQLLSVAKINWSSIMSSLCTEVGARKSYEDKWIGLEEQRIILKGEVHLLLERSEARNEACEELKISLQECCMDQDQIHPVLDCQRTNMDMKKRKGERKKSKKMPDVLAALPAKLCYFTIMGTKYLMWVDGCTERIKSGDLRVAGIPQHSKRLLLP